MAADKYRSAEDQYFRLRGYFDTGRLTQDQFDEKLRELMVQDEQGRYWTLGADSGKWYYYDGAKWMQGEPPTASASAAAAASPANLPPPEADPVLAARPAAAPPPMARAPAPPPVIPQTQYTEPRSFPIVPLLLVLLLLLIGVGAFFAYQNRDRIFVAQNQPQITPILPATITRAPSPTAPVATTAATPVPPSTTVPTVIPPTSVPTAVSAATDVPTSVPVATNVPATPVPAITIVVVTSEPIATIVPPAPPTATNLPPTNVPPTATKIPFTPTATSIPPTSTPSLPAGIYVTAITLNPSAPRRNQEIAFQATFVNTSGATQGYNWLIQIYDPNKAGTNKRFGESEIVNISVPPGTTQFTVKYPGVKGAGGCVSFYAQAEWQNADKSRTPFQDGKGNVLQTGFQVCPA